jgi:hypothetical protein
MPVPLMVLVMSTIVEKKTCIFCEKSMPLSDFKIRSRIMLEPYRLPWLEGELSFLKRMKQRPLKDPNKAHYDMGREWDEEVAALEKRDIKTADTILKAIDNAIISVRWVEISLNDYQKLWLKDVFLDWKIRYQFSLHSPHSQHQCAADMETESDIEMMGHFLKVLDMPWEYTCKHCFEEVYD